MKIEIDLRKRMEHAEWQNAVETQLRIACRNLHHGIACRAISSRAMRTAKTALTVAGIA
jgi:hypothetical protein